MFVILFNSSNKVLSASLCLNRKRQCASVRVIHLFPFVLPSPPIFLAQEDDVQTRPRSKPFALFLDKATPDYGQLEIYLQIGLLQHANVCFVDRFTSIISITISLIQSISCISLILAPYTLFFFFFLRSLFQCLTKVR